MTGAPTGILRAPKEGSNRFRVYVLFTTPDETRAALQHAARLSKGLSGEIALIATPIVPFPLPLDQPPASLEFALTQIRDLAQSVDRDIVGYIYLCRDPLQMLDCVLRPHSLVVIGLQKGWHFSRIARLARALRRRGHHVVTPREEFEGR